MHDLLSAAIEALATTFSGDIGRGLARLKYPIVFLIGFMSMPLVQLYAILERGAMANELWEQLYKTGQRFFWGYVAMGLATVFIAFINSPPPKKHDDSAAHQKPGSEMPDKTP